MSAQQFKRITKTQLKISTSIFLALVLLLPPVVNMYVGQANAGSLTSYNLQINNSQSAASNVTYTFNWTTSATTSIKQIDIQVCDAPSGTCNAPSGFAAGNEPTLSSDNIAGSGRTVTSPTDNAFRVVVTTPSTQSTQAMYLNFTGVTNPSGADTTYYARTTTYSDTGTTVIDGPTTTAFAVLDSTSIAVSATVDPNFSFSVAGVSSGGDFNGGTGNVNVTTTATTIPFGTLSSGTPKIAAHDVTITTNAGSGYTVTASHSGTTTAAAPLNSGSNNIDAFTGTNASPTTWSSPGGTTANTNTGFFGYSSEDATLCTGTAARFTSGGAKWAGSSTQGAEVICSTTGVSSQTTRLGWQAEINAIQPAGGYTGTVILIATPTY